MSTVEHELAAEWLEVSLTRVSSTMFALSGLFSKAHADAGSLMPAAPAAAEPTPGKVRHPSSSLAECQPTCALASAASQPPTLKAVAPAPRR